jgi:predicted Zn-dependent peptidase
LFADLLGGSEISPLYVRLVKETALFNDAACFYMRGVGEGLFMLYGILNDSKTQEEGEAALLDVFQEVLSGKIFTERDMERVKNKATTALLFEKATLINRAQKLCYFENLGHLEAVEEENNQYREVSLHHMLNTATATFKQDKVSVLYYSPKQSA